MFFFSGGRSGLPSSRDSLAVGTPQQSKELLVGFVSNSLISDALLRDKLCPCFNYESEFVSLSTRARHSEIYYYYYQGRKETVSFIVEELSA